MAHFLPLLVPGGDLGDLWGDLGDLGGDLGELGGHREFPGVNDDPESVKVGRLLDDGVEVDILWYSLNGSRYPLYHLRVYMLQYERRMTAKWFSYFLLWTDPLSLPPLPRSCWIGLLSFLCDVNFVSITSFLPLTFIFDKMVEKTSCICTIDTPPLPMGQVLVSWQAASRERKTRHTLNDFSQRPTRWLGG